MSVYLNRGVPFVLQLLAGEVRRKGEMIHHDFEVLLEAELIEQVKLAVGEPGLDPLFQELYGILEKSSAKEVRVHLHTAHDCTLAITHQSAGDPNDHDRGLRRLCHVKEVVQEGLIFVITEQIKLFEDKHDRLGLLVA